MGVAYLQAFFGLLRCFHGESGQALVDLRDRSLGSTVARGPEWRCVPVAAASWFAALRGSFGAEQGLPAVVLHIPTRNIVEIALQRQPPR